MDSREYLLNDGQKEIKLNRLSLNKDEWVEFLNKIKNDSISIKTGKGEVQISPSYLNNVNKKKCIPLINNANLFPDKGNFIAVTCGNLGNLYFRLHWALNSCPQTAEFSKDVNATPEKILSDFLKWWKEVKSSKLTGYIAISKVNDNKFRINDIAGFLSKSIDYEAKVEVKSEDDYDSLHVKYIFPWVLASEVCLKLSNDKVIGLPNDKGFISII